MRKAFIAAWAITVGAIIWGEVKYCQDLPWPPRIIGAGIVFGLLDIFSFVSEELAGVVAIGIVLAALVNKGFCHDASCCQHAEATAQPASYKALQGPADTLA